MIAGRYELGREIGRGGAGVVWSAHDTLLGRQVAMKQIGRSPGAGDVDLERAEREARLSASVRHPNVVSVFDLAIDDGDHWLVMEYVDGATLAQIVRDQGAMTHARAAGVMRQVADALAAAHDAGITHRDVKPSNILIDRAGTAKLTDFGIARTLTDPSLTRTGLLSGSPAYLAPEVATGQRGDMASDVWSWGATLFHLLAGHPPYDFGDNVIGGLYRMVHEETPRLSDAGPLTPVLAHTMVKNPAHRWAMTRVRDELVAAVPAEHDGQERIVLPPAEAAEAAAAVNPTQHLAPLPPEPVPASAAATAPWWRRPIVLAAGVLAVLLVAVVVLITTLGGNDAPPTAAPTGSPSTPSSTPPAKASVAGMRSFIEDYVRKVATDPAQSWPMLTPEFQKESGGFARYRAFWERAENGTVSDITADPATMRVTYRPHFDHWRNSANPTILDLVYRDGRYLISAEHTVGFKPAKN